MRKIALATALVVLGSVTPLGFASATESESASHATSNAEMQARQNWFNDAVGDILTGNHTAQPSATNRAPTRN